MLATGSMPGAPVSSFENALCAIEIKGAIARLLGHRCSVARQWTPRPLTCSIEHA